MSRHPPDSAIECRRNRVSSPTVNCLPWELGELPEAVTDVVVLGEPSAHRGG
jgi:hypothetical protein